MLRGPQGTLFGSGSEGGTVRFVTPGPNMHNASVYVRSEASYTQFGAPSYEVGVAGGAPIIDGVLGFRASAWNRRDGGYIDKASWYTGDVTQQNANYDESSSARLALGWQPVDGLTVTPSIFFQHIKANESNAFYLHSDGTPGSYGQPAFVNNIGDASNGNYVDLHNVHQFGDQRLTLPALKIDYQFSNMELLSNTSYYDRSQSGTTDFQSLEVGFWAHMVFPPSPLQLTPGFDQQADHFFTQEVRLQSTDTDSRFKWLVGVYYSHDISSANRSVYDPYLGDLMSVGFGCPAAQCVQAIFGVPQTTPYSFVGNTQLTEEQKAVFAQVDYKITQHFIATLGLRYSKLNNDWENDVNGPVNGLTSPAVQTGTSKANATTPKYMLAYKMDDALLYGSATKGFRNGGVNAPVGNNLACQEPLHEIGLNAAPTTYDPDHVWSYELGAKFALDQGRVQVDASVFQIDWANQIRNVSLTACTLSFTTNLGKTRSRGADLSVQWRATDPLTLGLAAGYQYVESLQDILSGGSFLTKAGEKLPGTQPSVTLTGTYNFTVMQKPSYFHVDYTYTGIQSGTSSQGTSLDPQIAGYTAAAAEFQDPSTKVANVRLGTNLDNWDVSVFVNNLFNSQPLLGETRGTVGFTSTPTGEITATTLRPRTIGVTGIYRF